MPLLSASELTKKYNGTPVVNGLSFDVQPGEIFGLLGPNGAGKTTTMMMLAGLLTPNSGRIELEGKEFDPENRQMRCLLGVVPQELAIYPDLTARENLNFFGRLYGLRGSELKSQIDLALQRSQLESHAEKLVDQYSGGMKRRLNFAIALLHRPKLLILDEPTVGVDPQSRSYLLDCIRELSREGMAVIYASHYMEEVQAICERVAIMDHGKMLACDELDELLAQAPADLRIAIEKLPDAQQTKLRESLPADLEWEFLHERTTLIVPDLTVGDEQHLQTLLAKILSILEQANVKVLSVNTREPNLEHLFLQLTGQKLRD